MKSLNDLNELVGTVVLVPWPNKGWDVLVEAEVLDARQVWGRLEALVCPVGGEGEFWTRRWQVPSQEE